MDTAPDGSAPDVAEYGRLLVAAVDAAVEEWVVDSVGRVAAASGPVDDRVVVEARSAAEAARSEVVPRLEALVRRDIDDQPTTPLAVLRDLRRYPTEVLRAAGVPAVPRDPDARGRFPDDEYDLVPATFADLGPAVAEAGMRWGAAKAFAHRARHGV